jgi:hypothetical protein
LLQRQHLAGLYQVRVFELVDLGQLLPGGAVISGDAG